MCGDGFQNSEWFFLVDCKLCCICDGNTYKNVKTFPEALLVIHSSLLSLVDFIRGPPLKEKSTKITKLAL